jgi:hypothetical protein
VRVLVVSLIAGLALCAGASAQPTRADKLTAAETTWVKPLLKAWTNMNKDLSGVIAQATAPNALLAGSPNNGKLTKTLVAFAGCNTSVKKAGAPPTARLKGFDTALELMCSHLAAGANDLAKGIGAVGKNNASLAKKEITAGYGEFVKATTDLKSAQTAIQTVGGQNIFKA